MLRIFTTMTAMTLLTFALAGCDVDKTEEGSLPNVDVSGDPGSLPEYDVDGPNVDVGTEEKSVTTPDVDVTMEEDTVTVPDVDVSLPKDE